MKYIEKYWSHCAASAPTLEKHYGRYYLRFAFEEKITLSETPIQTQRICSVNLGLNTDAVCSIMNSTGTILDRKFDELMEKTPRREEHEELTRVFQPGEFIEDKAREENAQITPQYIDELTKKFRLQRQFIGDLIPTANVISASGTTGYTDNLPDVSTTAGTKEG